MRRILSWLAGGLGAAAVVRQLLRRQRPVQPPPADPADDLRAKLQQAREAADDRDEFDASEGTPVDEVEGLPAAAQPAPAEPAAAESAPAEPATEPAHVERPEERPAEEGRSIEERRRAVHDKAQKALGHMRDADDD